LLSDAAELAPAGKVAKPGVGEDGHRCAPGRRLRVFVPETARMLEPIGRVQQRLKVRSLDPCAPPDADRWEVAAVQLRIV
jgi:hypothetical protein